MRRKPAHMPQSGHFTPEAWALIVQRVRELTPENRAVIEDLLDGGATLIKDECRAVRQVGIMQWVRAVRVLMENPLGRSSEKSLLQFLEVAMPMNSRLQDLCRLDGKEYETAWDRLLEEIAA